MRTPPATAPFVFLLIVCVFAGCRSDSKRDDRSRSQMSVVSHLGPSEVEAELLRNQVSSLRLDGMAEFLQPGTRRPGACRATLVFQREGGTLKLRLDLRRAMSGPLLKLGTDGQRICICNYAVKTAYEGLDHAYYDTTGVVGAFPDDLAELFHIPGIVGTRPSIFETQALAYQIQLIDIGDGEEIKVFRRINVARSDLAVVGYELFNPDGSRRAWIQAQDHQEHQGVKIPHRIFAAWPSAETSLNFIVSRVEINVETKAETFEVSVPSGMQTSRLDAMGMRRSRGRAGRVRGRGRPAATDWSTR